MKVPVVGVDRVSDAELVRIRTELRRAQFSAYLVEHMAIAITGQVDVVRQIAQQHSTLAPRVRKLEVDGEELREAHDEPGQFREDPLGQKIARFHGLDRAARGGLVAAFKGAGFDAEVDTESGAVLVEYVPSRKLEMEAVVEVTLADSGFEQVPRALLH